MIICFILYLNKNGGDNNMTDDERREIGLMRYGMLSALITGVYEGSVIGFFRDASKKIYTNPKGEKVRFAANTLERWYYNYKRDGFEALVPQRRSDTGRARKIDDDILEQIKYQLNHYPKLPATMIFQRLKENGTIIEGEVSLSTINRCVKELKSSTGQENIKEMRRYERKHINEVWYFDSLVGPWMNVDGKKKRIWIIVGIDDKSRLIVGIDAFFEDNGNNVFSVLKSAILKHGIPKICSFDQGSPYKNQQMSLLSARVGFALNYCEPYTPTSKANVQ